MTSPEPGRSAVPAAQTDPPAFTRREILKLVVGVVGLALAGVVLWAAGWDYVRWTEDFLPGTPPTDVLTPEAWTVSDDSVVFAAVGDSTRGGVGRAGHGVLI